MGLQKSHKSKVAFLEAKMLLLCLFFLSSCLPGSAGSAVGEFQANFKALVDQVSEETFLPVPDGKFQCNHVACQLEKTMKGLKASFGKGQLKAHVSLMEKNMACIISALNQAHARASSCQVTEMSPQGALRRYRRYFQKLNEKC